MAVQVCIIGGLGHVGLPFGAVLADRGFEVSLLDTSVEAWELVSSGQAPFVEDGLQPLLNQYLGKSLYPCLAPDYELVRAADHVVIAIGTPVDEHLNPRLHAVLGVVGDYAPHLKQGAHLMLRSTVFPGTTRAVARRLAELGRGDVLVSFCPERILQGQAVRELRGLPQIISGTSLAAVDAADAIFDRLQAQAGTTEQVYPIVCSPEEAELAKLFLNAWRYGQFALANQFYGLCVERGVDYGKVHRAMTYNYPRAAGLPTPGLAAGPCLGKDTMQLAASSMNGFPLGHAAWLVNEGLPELLVRQVCRALGGALDQGGCVGILGMAFKADVDDVRESLGFKVKKLLEFAGARVVLSDEYHQRPGWVTKEALLRKVDAVVIGVPHSAYKGLEIPAGKVVLDTWGVTVGGVRL